MISTVHVLRILNPPSPMCVMCASFQYQFFNVDKTKNKRVYQTTGNSGYSLSLPPHASVSLFFYSLFFPPSLSLSLSLSPSLSLFFLHLPLSHFLSFLPFLFSPPPFSLSLFLSHSISHSFIFLYLSLSFVLFSFPSSRFSLLFFSPEMWVVLKIQVLT